MPRLLAAVVYTLALTLANGASAEDADLAALRDGDMLKLTVHTQPESAALDTPFTSAEGSSVTLGDYAGQVVLVNFWATWCAPCRAEMPTLSAVQADLGGDGFTVLTIATGRNSPEGMTRFFEEIGVDNLPLATDPRQSLARDMGVLGLPVSVILDREGREVARLQGEADWSSESARAILAAVME